MTIPQEPIVCEDHPDRPWGAICCAGPQLRRDPWLCEHGACHCGAAGMASTGPAE